MNPAAFDLVLRNARVATASDSFDADIGITGGRIVQLGLGLPQGAREIDAAGRVVTPGGVDAHCHLDQPMPAPLRMADDFDSGTRAAACGGTTTVIPFAAQEKGQSLRAAVADYHHRAEGRAHVDYAFHLIVSDPTSHVTQQELPQLIEQGYTSIKIYMTYDDLKLDDRQIIEVLAAARRHGREDLLADEVVVHPVHLAHPRRPRGEGHRKAQLRVAAHRPLQTLRLRDALAPAGRPQIAAHGREPQALRARADRPGAHPATGRCGHRGFHRRVRPGLGPRRRCAREPPPMPFALFLPDSEVASVTRQGDALVIRLAAANVERAPLRHGEAAETGFSQGISLQLNEVAMQAHTSPLIGRIAQAALSVGGAAMTRVPVPFETSAPVRLELHLAQRTHVVASGRGLSVRFDGEANFRETFAC